MLILTIAHRIRDFQALPFIVGTNPRVEFVYQLYSSAFDRFRQLPEITTLEDNAEFCRLLEELLEQHLPAIPQLSAGMIESRKHLPPAAMDRFMNDILRTRIGRRVLAEQHIALSQDFASQGSSTSISNSTDEPRNERIGVVHTRCHAGQMVEKCIGLARMSLGSVELPKVRIQGDVNATFLYIPDHIEYIMFELLKNAMGVQASTGNTGEPVIVSIFASPRTGIQPASYISGRHSRQSSQSESARVSTVIFRVSDQAGGFPRAILPPNDPAKLWSFHHHSAAIALKEETVLEDDNNVSLSGKITDDASTSLKIGLQLARVFASYWGGDISVMTMPGYGSDVYVKIITSGEDSEVLTKE